MNKNFKLIKKEKINDIKSEYLEYEYLPLKTKIVWVKNKDKDRAFTIGFRTPPTNNKGINHILEHSVLRGSRKYPFQKEEVFAELLKKSVTTFLNASTYPDKTIYPFSSNNEKEFLKILDVYLDAVFYPKVLEDRKIFQQEGWRYDLDENRKLFFNGVVFNEMKGRYSGTNRNIWEGVTKNLFKDTVYSLESGGDPKEILNLEYKELVEYHKKYYHPSNSIIYFYGDLKIEKIFDYLEKEFLGNFKYKKINSKIKQQKKYKKEIIKTEKYFTPVEKENSILSFNFITGNSFERLKNLEASFINGILFRGNSALLKSKLLESGLVKKIESDLELELGQTFLNINLKGVETKNFKKLEKIFWNSLVEIVENGISKDVVVAEIDSMELIIKSKNLKVGKGLGFGEKIITQWNYDQKNLEDFLKINDIFDEFKNNLNKKNYLEKLIKKYLLDNQNRLILKLKADSKIDVEKEIKNKIKKINALKNKDKILKEIQEFKEWEKIEEPKEYLDLIKPVNKNNFPKAIKNFEYEVFKKNNLKYLFTKLKNKDVESFVLSFDISALDEKEIQYLELIGGILRKVDFKTEKFGADEILRKRKRLVKDLSFVLTFTENKKKEVLRRFNISWISLTKNREEVFEFINLVLNDVVFDKNKFKQILKENISNFEESLAYSGHRISDLVNLSSWKETSFLTEQVKGISFYKFLKEIDLEKDFEKIEKIYKNLFSKKGLILSHGSKKKDEKIFDLIAVENKEFSKKKINFRTSKTSKAYSFNSLRNSFNSLIWGIEKNKIKDYVFDILMKYVSLDYLWKKIREEGGAYGGGVSYKKGGLLGFYSYMDSRIEGSYNDYLNTDNYLENLKLDQETIDSLIGKRLADYLMPQSELAFAWRNLFYELKGEKDREKKYQETFKFNQKDIQKLAKELKKNKKNITKVTLGNIENIKKAKNEFNKIEEF